jgi:hypothetical protein
VKAYEWQASKPNKVEPICTARDQLPRCSLPWPMFMATIGLYPDDIPLHPTQNGFRFMILG